MAKRWTAVWRRAVIEPATRRAAALWIGAGLFASVSFGPTAMQPHDVTELTLTDLAGGTTVLASWILMFSPVARLLLRPAGASFLYSLPAPRWPPIVLTVGALVGLQLPWLALWIIGDGWRGLIVIAATTVPIAAIGWWQPRPRAPRLPRWRGATTALVAIHLRALRRRSGDAIVRAAGLALLAGAGGGLFVHNNALTGPPAATLGVAVIAILLVPAVAGALLTVLDSHLASAWLAASLGISAAGRTAALAATATLVYVVASVLAMLAASAIVGSAIAWLGPAMLAFGASLGVAVTSALVRAGHAHAIAARAIVGIVVVTGVAELWLGLLGIAGIAAMAATAAVAIARVE